MPTKLQPRTPVFFKCLPKTENTPTNAIFVRYMDVVLDNEQVVEVLVGTNTWTCKESEALTKERGLAQLAINLNAEFEKARTEIKTERPGGKITQPELAKHLGIGVTALINRLAIIKTFLPKTQE